MVSHPLVQAHYNVIGATRFHLAVMLPMSDEIPRGYRLRDHSLKLVGAGPRSDLLTGAYGVNGRETLRYIAAKKAIASHARALTIDFNYTRRRDGLVGIEERRANIEEKRRSVTELEIVNIGMISRAQRDELAEILIDWAPGSRLGKKQHPADMLLEMPSLVHRLFDECAELSCVVYPARVELDPFQIVWVGTIRPDPARITNAHVLHMPGATVEI